MSWIQRFFLAVLPRKLGESMERDSRAWKLRCESCGAAQSIWDIGGIRWRAIGNSLTWRKCPTCGRRSVHRFVYEPQSRPRAGPE